MNPDNILIVGAYIFAGIGIFFMASVAWAWIKDKLAGIEYGDYPEP